MSLSLTHGYRKLSYRKGTQVEEKFLLVWSPQFIWKLSPVSPPAMNLRHTLTSFIYPRRTGLFQETHSSRRAGSRWCRWHIMPFPFGRAWNAQCARPGDDPGLPIQVCIWHPDRNIVTSAGWLSWRPWLWPWIFSDLPLSLENFESRYDCCCPIFALDKENKASRVIVT